MKYEIRYYFDGEGKAIVEANSQEEAEENWRKGEIESEDEWGDNYVIEETNEE